MYLSLRDMRVPVLFVLLCSGLLFAGSGYQAAICQTTDNVAVYKDHLKKGDTYLAAKNYAAAMFEYEKASDLMPNEEEPKLKMQSIEATLGINELAEVKRKVEIAMQQEQEQLRKAAAAKTASTEATVTEQPAPVMSAGEKESLRKSILDSFAEE